MKAQIRQTVLALLALLCYVIVALGMGENPATAMKMLAIGMCVLYGVAAIVAFVDAVIEDRRKKEVE